MASIRGEIHMNELQRFTDWLKANGWIQLETKGEFEVLRVARAPQMMIFYKRMRSAHLSSSLEDHYIYWTDKYRNEMRQLKTAGKESRE